MQAIILAGGLGSRLKPFTEVIPKPLLPIGEKSVLEIQISKLKAHGFDEILLATNYKSDYIRNFFGDGNKLGVKLTISKEEKPLGTCGPLSLLKDKLTKPFLVMNGDVLTTADFTKIYNFALGVDAVFTVVTKEISTPFEFGNVLSNGDYISNVEEKTDIKTEIVAGIYILKPQALSLIPDNQYFGMDDLIQTMLTNNMPVARYLLKEYWIDIGRIEDFEGAEVVYDRHFKDHEL
jgi:NDP-sugar pyrophosphorylase family protein